MVMELLLFSLVSSTVEGRLATTLVRMEQTILLSIVVTSCEGLAVNVDVTMKSFSLARRRSPTNRRTTDLQTYLNEDSYRCAMSLRSELRSVETLLKVSKNCLCPKLKTYADELYKRKIKLKDELKMRSDEEKLCA
jgi:hypothetical protein